MIRVWLAVLLFAGQFLVTSQALGADAAHVTLYVAPYYDSSGPVVKVGTYSAGLASPSAGEFVETIRQMRTHSNELTFMQLYVAAIQLYDRGYRSEATYWFYCAQYRGRQFGLLLDRSKMGGLGDRGFELYQAQEAFWTLAGPTINGFAFRDVGLLSTIVRRVASENHAVPAMMRIYPGVTFVDSKQWAGINAGLNAGLGKLAAQVEDQKAEIERQRRQNGTQARYEALTSTPFPGGY